MIHQGAAPISNSTSYRMTDHLFSAPVHETVVII